MDQRTRAAVAAGAIGVIFLLVQVGALALVEPLKQSGLQPVENPQNVGNSILYFGVLLVATAAMLAAIKYDLQWVIRAMVVFTGGYIAFLLLVTVAPEPAVAGVPLAAVVGAGTIVVGLLVHPEWYVIDAAGVVMGAGAAGLFGISFGVLPAIVLLSVLAIYDAISVYGTEHMLTLASGVMELKIPVVLVVPLSLSYSFLDAEMPDPVEADEPADGDGDTAEGDAADGTGAEVDLAEGTGAAGDAADSSDAVEEADAGADGERDDADAGPDPLDREALFIGLGDAVIPTVLVASAAFFAPGGVPSLPVPFLALTLPALTAMAGTFAGLAVLLWMVLKGRAHAGLPLLNGGAIAGYLLGALLSGVSVATAIGL